MGYKPKRTVYRLKFQDAEFDGLEVDATSLPVGELLQLIDIAVSLPRDADHKKLTPEQMKMVRDLFEGFARALKRWNVEDDDDRPVPATVEGLYSQELTFVMQIIGAWMETIGSVNKDLGKASTSGLQFPEGSLPMVPKSLNLTS